jgi:phospholipid/cholesterol/gamma-HCH transport system substrate-binding protein
METRANHVLIGSFMLLMIGVLFGFIIWLARADRGTDKEYDIFFRGAVTGLDEGGVVRFNGVPVGLVKRIALVPDDPGQVRVRVGLRSDVPVLRGATAILDVQGFTGIAFVQIEGGFAGQPPIVATGDQPVPVIPARPSAIQSLFLNAPQLLEQATVAVTRIGMLLNEPNRKAIGNTLANVDTLTTGIARRTPELERTVVELEGAVKDLRAAAQALNDLAQSTQATVEGDLPAVLGQTRQLLQRTDTMVSNLDKVLVSAQPGVEQFSDTTVPEANRLILELRQLTRSLKTLAEKLETDGGAALFGGAKVPDYEPK